MSVVDVSDGDKAERREGYVLALGVTVATLVMIFTSWVLALSPGLVTNAGLAVSTYVARLVAIPTMLAVFPHGVAATRDVASIGGLNCRNSERYALGNLTRDVGGRGREGSRGVVATDFGGEGPDHRGGALAAKVGPTVMNVEPV